MDIELSSIHLPCNAGLALIAALLVGSLFRLIRLQVGGALIIAALTYLIFLRPGWENTVYIFDFAIMHEGTLLLFLFFVACEWTLRALHLQFRDLAASLTESIRSPQFLAALLPSLGSLLASPQQVSWLCDETLEGSESREDQVAIHLWYRPLLMLLVPTLSLPIALAYTLNVDFIRILETLWVPTLIWLVGGLRLLTPVTQVKLVHRPGHLPAFKVLLITLALLLAAAFLSFTELVAVYWIFLAVWLLADAPVRQQLWKRRHELQFVRWFFLAAGVAVWSWLFSDNFKVIHNGALVDLSQVFVQSLQGWWWVYLTLVPLAVSLISGSLYLTLILTGPLVILTPLGLNALLPTAGAALIGTVLSPEYRMLTRNPDAEPCSSPALITQLAASVLTVAVMLAIFCLIF